VNVTVVQKTKTSSQQVTGHVVLQKCLAEVSQAGGDDYLAIKSVFQWSEVST
jgi:hypothetical protein